MSVIYTDLILKNAFDVCNAEKGIIGEQEVRLVTTQALVDTDAWTLVINEETREKLGLEIVDRDWGTLADGTRSIYNVAGPIEAMDLMVHPRLEEVVGEHGDQVDHRV